MGVPGKHADCVLKVRLVTFSPLLLVELRVVVKFNCWAPERAAVQVPLIEEGSLAHAASKIARPNTIESRFMVCISGSVMSAPFAPPRLQGMPRGTKRKI